jgi:hypothetical protein
VILVMGMLLRAPRQSWRMLPGLSVTALPAAAYYLWLFGQGGGWQEQIAPGPVLQTGGSTLAGWLYAVPEADLGGHSLVTPLGFLGFWLWFLTPFFRRGQAGWKGLWMLAFVALVASFGASLRVVPGGEGLPLPLAWIHWPALAFFRFPLRLLWLYQLTAGMLASQLLAERWQGRAWWVGLALVDVLGTGMPGRLARGIAEVPSAYLSVPAERAVLDVYGETLDPSSGEMEMRSRILGCYYQGVHHRPIPEVCIGTGIRSPREGVSRWLMGALSAAGADPKAIVKTLGDAGIGAVALHLDTLRPADAEILKAGLGSVLGPPVAETKDGGERLQIFSLTTTQGDVLSYRRHMKGMEGR